MKKPLISYTALLILLLSFSTSVYGQIGNAQDSIIYYIDQFADQQIDDTSIQIKIRELSRQFNAETFDRNDLQNTLKKLKANVDAEKYYALTYYLLDAACYTDTSKNYSSTINFGLNYIEELKSSESYNLRFIFLNALRDLRVPYRNSDLIYEGIEVYSGYASEFHQRNDSDAISLTYNVLASLYHRIGLSDKAVYFQLKSIDYLNNEIHQRDTTTFGLFRPPNIGLMGIINRHNVLGLYLISSGKPEEAIIHLRQAQALSLQPVLQKAGLNFDEGGFAYLQFARAHVFLKSDSLDFYLSKMKERIDSNSITTYLYPHYLIAHAYSAYLSGNLDSAEARIETCIKLIEKDNFRLTNIGGTIAPNRILALIRIKQGRYKDAIAVLKPEIQKLREANLRVESLTEMKLLAEAYTLDGDFNNASKAYNAYSDLQEQYMKEERNNRSISFEIEKRMAKNEESVRMLEEESKFNQKRQYYLLGILGLAALLVFALFTRNRYRQKVNKELIVKNKEIESTLHQLKATQSQLVQSEKMASLGELTAGIAHEIQNPLNFVNNFSEINAELIDEMKEELVKDNKEEANSIADDIKENEEKIMHHGKRADAIVKGMLQHSRSGSGEKEPTDINALADEYLRLAYHGLRAKDKSFNAKMETDFDSSIGNINVVQQDIGRVMLNLITNAFHAVSSAPKADTSHEPTVIVRTKRLAPPLEGKGGNIQITVSDNGPGIPKDIVDKIFQPFFTTKPTGKGTGLGLSLAYDIIKSHGGELKVETEEGKGSEFKIILPV